MKLEELLAQKKKVIIDKWFDAVVNTYPSDTSRFIKSQKNPFANPVGSTTHKGLSVLMDELLGEMNADTINSFLDPIIRIRAIQDFTPSGAVSFVFSLKDIIKDQFKDKEFNDHSMLIEVMQFYSKIDLVAKIGFDIYMKCREKIYHIKANEEKNRTFRAFERAGLIKEIPDNETESQLI
ncbi:MAG: RsbRD N-terminal domain-containing protein [Proteobacteria bacterium]|nr:RsbRD N-terminal domain-containing protein [Pseudomonadota bacterium]